MRAQDLVPYLICPACRCKVVVAGQALSCERCQVRYPSMCCGYDFTTAALPAQLQAKIPLWEVLQSNGSLSYRLAPQLNLATAQREDVAAFRSFMKLRGRVLDVGCGPQSDVPGYIDPSAQVQYVGLDPLSGASERRFMHIRAIAELLPFADHTFDQIIFATSLDHLLDIEVSLDQAARVLKPDGRVYLWVDNLERAQDMSSPLARAGRIIVRGCGQAFAGLRRMGLRQTLRYLREAGRMRVPAGAVDYFHLKLPTVDEVVRALGVAGLCVTARKVYQRSLFLEAGKDPTLAP